MAKTEVTETTTKGGISVLGLLVLSLMAVAGGVGFGMIVPGLMKPDKAEVEEGKVADAAPASDASISPLDPITTNLAKPATIWIRLETMLVVEKDLGGNAEALKKQMSEDMLGYLRTLTLDQISGPSGFQHLREDLSDRVRVRSQGRVSGVIITSMILE